MIRVLSKHVADRDGALLGKLIRFVLVGGTTGLVYGAVVFACINWLGMAPGWAGAVGYGAAVPLNFLGHRQFAFRADGSASKHLFRYGVSTATGVAISSLIMHLSVSSGFGVLAGVVVTIATVPAFTFVLLDSWVFQDKRQIGRSFRKNGHP